MINKPDIKIFAINALNIIFLLSSSSSSFRFNISQTPIETVEYLHDISNIFISKVLNECGDGCSEARSEKHVSVRLLVQSNETEITWNTDESYRLDVITSGRIMNLIFLRCICKFRVYFQYI